MRADVLSRSLLGGYDIIKERTCALLEMFNKRTLYHKVELLQICISFVLSICGFVFPVVVSGNSNVSSG